MWVTSTTTDDKNEELYDNNNLSISIPYGRNFTGSKCRPSRSAQNHQNPTLLVWWPLLETWGTADTYSVVKATSWTPATWATCPGLWHFTSAEYSTDNWTKPSNVQL